jgi:hypothetical protein
MVLQIVALPRLGPEEKDYLDLAKRVGRVKPNAQGTLLLAQDARRMELSVSTRPVGVAGSGN